MSDPNARLNDPGLMPLIHPVRIDAAMGEPVDTLMFERLGVMAVL